MHRREHGNIHRLMGSYTLTVTDISKSDYTFDPANSVATKTVKSR